MGLQRLYIRIWLAVVLAVAVLSLLVGWVWRLTAEPPLHEVVVRNANGEIIGAGLLHPGHLDPAIGLGGGWTNGFGLFGPPRHGPAAPPDGADTPDKLPPGAPEPGHYGNGPEFFVKMVDGTIIHLHLPRPVGNKAGLGFFGMLGLVAIAVALALFPIIRRLTRRLESLQHSIERWGEGDLSARIPQTGHDEVASLAAGFNRAAAQIETLVSARDALLAAQKSLLANASHELRSPLARIRMGLEFMGDATGPVRNEISQNIMELDQLIDEILLSSRIDAKEADLGTVEAVDLVGLSAEECARTHAQLDVEVGEIFVPGVSKLLRRVVRNLLENARRYGAGDINLTLRSEAGFAVIEVNDRGPGVPAALRERIFEPFYRLPGASEREGGVGLGLALVRSIVFRHQGSVVCRDRVGGGATFAVHLPLAAIPPTAVPALTHL